MGEKGSRTRRRLPEAAEQAFADLGYHDASIVKITEAAVVSQGTFYLYCGGKQEIFGVLVEDLLTRLCHVMPEAPAKGGPRVELERLGFGAFFRLTAGHPALYRVIRQAELVPPKALRLHYERLAEGYVAGLRGAGDREEIAIGDPVGTAWALMAVGEMIGMRWILWAASNRCGSMSSARPWPSSRGPWASRTIPGKTAADPAAGIAGIASHLPAGCLIARLRQDARFRC